MKQSVQVKRGQRTAVMILFPLLLSTILILAFASQPTIIAAQTTIHSGSSQVNFAGPKPPQTITISASQDNTLYEEPSGSLSNGQGQYFFVGTTASGQIRRGLIAFDLAGAIPSGATILSATLSLNMSKTITEAQPIALHTTLAAWGEGDSNASGEEGAGADATQNDATWLHTFYTSTLWAQAGGDFTPTASATTLVNNVGLYVWRSPQMLADVQTWFNAPENNFGWLLMGNETATTTAKRFDSRENPIAANRPMLVITYQPPHFDFHIYLPYVAHTTIVE